MDENTLQKLDGAFADGASDKMACFLAGISDNTLYNYQKEHPEYIERKTKLKDSVKFQAKKVIREAVNKGDVETSKWYAERKMKDEFSLRTEISADILHEFVPQQELSKTIKNLKSKKKK